MAGFRPHPARPGPDRAAKPQAAAWQPMTPALRLAAQPVCSIRTTSRSFGRLVSFLAFAARFRAGWRGQAPTPRSGAITVDSASVVSLACRSPSRCDLARMVSIRTMTMFPVIFANTRQSQPRRSRNPPSTARRPQRPVRGKRAARHWNSCGEGIPGQPIGRISGLYSRLS